MTDISPFFVFRGLGDAVYSVLLSPNSSTNSGIIWSGSEEGSVSTFSLVSKRRTNKWKLHDKAVISLNLNHEQDKIISQSRDGCIKEWNIETGKINFEISTDSINFCRLAYSNSNSSQSDIIATSNQDSKSISLWDLKMQKEVAKFAPKDPAGLCMAISFESTGTDQYLVSAFENGSIYYWDLKTFSVINELISGWKEPIFSFAIDDHSGVFGGAKDEIIKFNFSNNFESSKITNQVSILKPGINHIAIRKDKKIFASAGWDYRIRVFSWKKCTPLAILKCHTSGVQQIRFSEVDNLLVAAGQDCNISLWNIY